MNRVAKPRVLVAIRPQLLEDLVVRLLADSGRFEVVSEDDTGPVDAAIHAGRPMPRGVETDLVIRLPDAGAPGIGTTRRAGRSRRVRIVRWADVVGLLGESFPATGAGPV